MPADQPAHGEASASAGDLIGALIEGRGEIRHARSAIDQGKQHAQFHGGQLAPFEQFKYAIKRGLRNGRSRFDVVVNHAPNGRRPGAR
jgi:hypothetical protein